MNPARYKSEKQQLETKLREIEAAAVARIQGIVAAHDRLPVNFMRSKVRGKQCKNESRMKAIFLSRRLLGLSFPVLGRHFGGKNHGTIMHACRCIQDRMAVYPAWRANLQEIEKAVLNEGQ